MMVEISISAIAQHKKHLQVVFFVLRVLVAQYGSQPNSWSTVAILSFRATTQKTELSWTNMYNTFFRLVAMALKIRTLSTLNNQLERLNDYTSFCSKL
jgi:hypothetical protein